MTLTNLNTQLIVATTNLVEFDKDTDGKRNNLTNIISGLQEKINLVAAGLDTGKIDLAKSAFIFSYDKRSTVTDKAIQDAINLLCTKPEYFNDKYIGVKIYSGFGHQRADNQNWLGPTHGCIVFRIQKEKDEALTPEKIEAVIYFLMNWASISEAEAAA